MNPLPAIFDVHAWDRARQLHSDAATVRDYMRVVPDTPHDRWAAAKARLDATQQRIGPAARGGGRTKAAVFADMRALLDATTEQTGMSADEHARFMRLEAEYTRR